MLDDVARAAGATVIRPPVNTGSKAGAQNYAMRYVKTEFTMAIDADTTVAPDSIEHFMKVMADPTVAAAGPSSNMVAGPQSTTQQLDAPCYLARYLIGFCLLVRRSALYQVGGIDTALPGGDDIDLSIRLRQTGYKLICDRRSFVYHYGFRTGERVHGKPDQPWGWNSPAMIDATANALIAKHGRAAFNEAWRNDPLGIYETPVAAEVR